MKIKIHSAELNRMMKTLGKCIDNRMQSFGNIEVIYDNNLLTLRGTNGQFSAVMSTPVMGGTGETFCVDGEMFGKACALGKGEIEIVTEGKSCIVRGTGRVRIPIVNADIPSFVWPDDGISFRVLADYFSKAFNGVEHAISTDFGQARIALTGVKVEVTQYSVKMIALDGFKLSIECAQCDGEQASMVVPGAFMRLIKDSTFAGEEITIKSDGKRIMAQTEGMMISCPLLNSEFPDYLRVLPKEYKTECLVNAEQLKTALKNSAIICNNGKPVKFEIGRDKIKVSGNSEQADYEADVPCETNGNELIIAFNQKYIVDTITSINAENIVLQFNMSSSPCVAKAKDEPGIRLVLPVRVQG